MGHALLGRPSSKSLYPLIRTETIANTHIRLKLLQLRTIEVEWLALVLEAFTTEAKGYTQ